VNRVMFVIVRGNFKKESVPSGMITLTIVIPAFEEEKKIARDVESAALFLASHSIRGEVVVTDDGSSDQTATRAAGVAIPPGVHRTVLRSDSHRGKGSAVRTGILASRGEYVMFADSGLTIPFDNALTGLRLLQEENCDIAHGSRELQGSIIRKDRDWDRKIFSRCFHALVVCCMQVPPSLSDTQCGFKVYRGDVARQLYAECTTDGFMFDIEIILRAIRHGYRIAEFPVEWSCDRDSRLGVRQSSVAILRELYALRRTVLTPQHPART
jgi:dolichyl-phosphate beta-glucosyltransferase